jgi:hypothetical protein
VAPVPGHAHGRAAGTAWALSFLSTLASVIFAVGAIAAWVVGLWPATPLTLALAAAVVLAGPLAATLHFASARGQAPRRSAPAPRARLQARPVASRACAPRPLAPSAPSAPLAPLAPLAPSAALTTEQAWGRALLEWRDRPLRRS